LVEGNIIIPSNTLQHWRVLLAYRAANMKTHEFGPGVEVMLLARDGVWRTVAPKEITDNQLEMTGASRADFAIRTTSDSWIKVDGTTVANIYTGGITDESVHPYDGTVGNKWEAIRPNYLRDLRAETNVNTEAVSMGARTINGGKFNINEPTFQLPASQVQEWSLSGAVQHPFHLHVYHVQALKDDNDFEAGEYYDVVASKMSIRFDLNQGSSTVYDGRTILHCHILSHEDRGAMGWLDVDGGEGPPTFPGNTYSEYYILDGAPTPPAAPSALTATAASSSTIELSWMDNAGDEDGFILERSLDGSNFTLLTSLPSFNGMGLIAYTDSELNPETTYWYRLSAYNSEGNSAYSNIANAITQSSGGVCESPNRIICHVKKNGANQELCVDPKQYERHIAHGDTEGPCPSSISRSGRDYLKQDSVNSNIKFWPNPSDGSFNLNINLDNYSRINLHVYDINGRLIQKATDIIGDYRFGETLRPGIYFVKIYSDGNTLVTKLIKQ
jgi:hypothetical protein